MKKLEKEVFTASTGESIEITHGSGNVFADIGLPDAELLQFKAGLIHEINQAIKMRGLTSAQAAAMIGLDQATLTKMLNGQFLHTSSDRLFEILNILGRDVEVRVGAETSLHNGHLVLT